MDPSSLEGMGLVAAPNVRPFEFLENRPVVRQLGQRELFIGNKFAALPDTHDHDFETVLSLTNERFPLTTHHCPLIDGADSTWSSFEEAVDTARALYQTEGPVLVHCEAGISRSSTVLATTLAVEENRTFRDSLSVVQQARSFAIPNPALHKFAVIYLAAEEGH